MSGARRKKCCVPDCNNKDAPRHSIPAEKSVRDIWIQRIGNEKLQNLDNKRALGTYVVCHSHFSEVCKDADGKLVRYSLPTINLPDFHENPTRENSFCYPSQQNVETPEKVGEILAKFHASMPSTSRDVAGEELNVLRDDLPRRYQSAKRQLSNVSVEYGTHGIYEVMPQTLELAPDAPPEPPALAVQVIFEEPVEIYNKTTTSGLRKTKKIFPARTMLTPNEKLLHKEMLTLKRSTSRMKSHKLLMRKELQLLRSSRTAISLLKNVNEPALKFFISQQRTQKQKPRGRRFSVDDKIFALSLYKQSGKGYRYLSKVFSLPSRKTLSTMLNKIPFGCGINSHIFEHLKKSVARMREMDKYCVLIFDEVSLDCGLEYNQKLDVVEGFVDHGGSFRRAAFADHALVFMVRGIYRKWKQPVCFTLCEGTTSTLDLKRTLKNVIMQVKLVGLNIVATICDQGATNQAVINSLIKDTNEVCIRSNQENRYQGYLIGDTEIIHLYDFPHLMKGIRNGLLTKDLHFTIDGVEKVASWSHIVQLYENQRDRGQFNACYKLTDEHVIYPEKIRKKEVKNCTQVFSHSVAVMLNIVADYSSKLPPNSEGTINPKAVDTSELLMFFDKLFDSVNGTSVMPPYGKELRSAVTAKSKHMSFWDSCLPILNTMYFTSPKSQKKIITPSMKNWIFSLRGLMYLWNSLQGKGFKFLSTRSLNQDPVENYFACVRNHGVRNTNPTCSSFISSSKSLLVNNFVSAHSAGANCEADDSIGVLNTLRSFIEQDEVVIFDPPGVLEPVYPLQSVQDKSSVFGDYASSYVAGYVAKKICRHVSTCSCCTNKISAADKLPENILIRKKQYVGSKLIHPSSNFSAAFKSTTEVIIQCLPRLITSYGIKEKLKVVILENCQLQISDLFCSDHQVNVNMFIKFTVDIVLYRYISSINKILHGKDLRGVKESQDPLKSLAMDKYNKRRKNKRQQQQAE